MEDNLFKLDNNGLTLNSTSDFEVVQDSFDTFKELSKTLLSLNYQIRIHNGQISIIDDYQYLITKYSDYTSTSL